MAIASGKAGAYIMALAWLKSPGVVGVAYVGK